MKHHAEIATRLDDAETWLIDLLANTAQISVDDAGKVAAIYKRAKVVKRDAMMGKYLFKHGAFLDKETILHALSVS